MRPGLAGLYALLEALLALAFSLGIPLVVTLMGWLSIGDFALGMGTVWGIAVAAWALGHGATLHIALPHTTTLFSGDSTVFDISVAPLGILFITMWVAYRIGRRLVGIEDAPLLWGLISAFFTALVGLILWSVHTEVLTLDLPIAMMRIAAPFVVGVVWGWAPWREYPARVPAVFRTEWASVVARGLRSAGATILALIVLAAVLTLGGIVTGFANEISLYESLHGEIVGGFVITALQLAAIPTFLVWMMSWIVGPGFSLGVGSSITASSHAVGAIPALPIFGALPPSLGVGWWIHGIPVVIAAVVAGRFTRGLVQDRFDIRFGADLGRLVVFVVTTAVTAAVVGLLLGSYVNGSLGPGRFASFGVDAVALSLWLGGLVAGGTLVGALISLLSAGGSHRPTSVRPL